MNLPTLSIIIPCYNEEEGIPNLVQQLNPALEQLQKEYQVELLLVDDGSEDQTNALLHQFYGDNKNTKIVKHEKNKNLGAALKTGFAFATSDLIAVLDSDCTYNPSLLIPMLKMMDEKTDIVTVSPYHPQGKVNNVAAYRIFLSKSVSRIYRLLLRQKLYTYTAMVRVYRKDVIKQVTFKSDTFLGVTELFVKAILQGYKVKEFPTELNVRKFGESKIKTVPVRVIGNHLGLISKIIRYKIVGTTI